MKTQTETQLQSQIYAFNKSHYIGDRVKVKMDNGEIKICTIKAPASILGDHMPIIWLNEFKGCYALNRVVI